jgi:hypothetical protein
MHVEKKHFYVKETKTGFLIKKYNDKKLAWSLINKLNRGSGFAGESPTFFALKA